MLETLGISIFLRFKMKHFYTEVLSFPDIVFISVNQVVISKLKKMIRPKLP